MSNRPDTTTGKVVKTDDQGRKLQVIDTSSLWSEGYSYNLSWDEALNNALTGVVDSGTPEFTFQLWDAQHVFQQPGPSSVLAVGLDYTP